MWPLLTGLAIGFLVGREVGNSRGSGGGETAAVVAQGRGRHQDAGEGLQGRERVSGGLDQVQPIGRRSPPSASRT